MKKNKLLLALLACAALLLSGCDDVKGYGNPKFRLKNIIKVSEVDFSRAW